MSPAESEIRKKLRGKSYCISMKEREIVINIERCENNMNQEAGCCDVPDDKVGNLHSFKGCGMPVSVDVLGNGENSKNGIDMGGVSPESGSGEKARKERRLSMSAKKPPRPPRGLSLDAADQKLIKEISELLIIKRARIERMKALKKTKAAKGTSASASSSGNLIAMLFTLLFCIVIIFQGCHPWGIFLRNSSAVGIPISPKTDEAMEGGIFSLQYKLNLSTNSVQMLPEVESPNLLAAGSDNKGEGGRGSIR